MTGNDPGFGEIADILTDDNCCGYSCRDVACNVSTGECKIDFAWITLK
jgi:hypothetical protein